MKFNSQICTSREQSERLLALGLKKETADMCWQTTTLNGEPITYPSQDVWMNGSIITNNHFPAWSLHRLIEIVNNTRAFRNWLGADIVRDYDHLIDIIKIYIEEGCLPKEYLEE